MNNSSHLVEEISQLSDSELSDRLVDFGFSRTPVTIMTRKYLEKQLVSKINQTEGRKQNDDNNKNPLNGMSWSENTAAYAYSPEKENQINSNNAPSAETATTFYAVFCPSDSTEIGMMITLVS